MGFNMEVGVDFQNGGRILVSGLKLSFGEGVAFWGRDWVRGRVWFRDGGQVSGWWSGSDF